MSRLETLLSSPCSAIPAGNTPNKAQAAVSEHGTLGDLRSSQATVYDFWTTRCTNCPAALDNLDVVARQRPSVTFVAVNIDDFSAAQGLVEKAASEGRWTSLKHAHLSEDEKEKAKELLGMRTVPFYVIVDKDGAVLRHGNARSMPLASAKALDLLLTGGGQNENIPAVANASPEPSNKKEPPNSGMECEGGVCKLVRKKKVIPDAAAKDSVGSASAPVVVAAAAAVATPAPAQAPVPARGAMECEGGVCKLVRKKKPAEDSEKITSTPAAVPAGGDAPSRSVECEGGVCKLVRKMKGAGLEEGGKREEAAKAVVAEKAGVVEGSLVVGDVMPSLRVVLLEDGEVKTLEDISAGRSTVLDFWTTRCVRCPAALDALDALAAEEESGAVVYVSVNLDDLEGARKVVSSAEGRWSSLTHVFAGRDEDSEALEKFKSRAGLKSVPFYVVLGRDGRIEQIGGPKAVSLGKKTETANALPTPLPTRAPIAAVGAAAAPEHAAYSFTMDEDF